MIPKAEDKPLLNVKEVAQIFGVSLATVYRMIHNGQLETVMVGGKKSTRIRTADLRKFAGLEA